MKQIDKNTKLLFGLAIGVAVMVGLAYASVPLYSLFCRATGFAGTPIRVASPLASPDQAASIVKDKSQREITVTFDGNVDPALPWTFYPETKNLTVKLGEDKVVKYFAKNNGATPLVGTATYNVQPDRAGAYFDKVQCFCFTKQVLKPGETAELTVEFYVDPSITDDVKNDDVKNITLSYTFFLAKDQSKAEQIKQAHLKSSEQTSNP